MTETPNKEEILNSQKSVANSLSDTDLETLEKNGEFHNDPFQKNEMLVDNDNLLITRGWFDFKAINIRYTDKNIFNKFFPKTNKQQNYYKLFNYSRSIYLGSCEYKGCKINIKKYFNQLNLLFGYELEKKEAFLFKSLIDFFEKKKKKYTFVKKILPKTIKIRP